VETVKLTRLAMDYGKESVELHAKLHGKLAVRSKIALAGKQDLSLAYTPGVGQVCVEIARDPRRVFDLTIKHNTVAVVSDGSAILGLGNLGAAAAIPVMEGKAVLFKEFAGVDAFPICLATQDVDAIVTAVRAIAPVFGGINLEDISAPRCFEVEARLQDLGIPVFHDDQHGTAIVTVAALLNALRITGKNLAECTIVFSGSGASAIACTRRPFSARRRYPAVRLQGNRGPPADRSEPFQARGRRDHQPPGANGQPHRRAARRGHLHRTLATEHRQPGDGPFDESAPDRFRHGESGPGDHASPGP